MAGDVTVGALAGRPSRYDPPARRSPRNRAPPAVPPPPAPGRGAAGGASRPWEGGRGAPVGAAGELAAPAGEVERWRRSRRAKRAAEREARGARTGRGHLPGA